MLTVLNRDYSGGGTFIPMKDCWCKGNIPDQSKAREAPASTEDLPDGDFSDPRRPCLLAQLDEGGQLSYKHARNKFDLKLGPGPRHGGADVGNP